MARFIIVPIMIPSHEDLMKFEKEVKEKEKKDRYFRDELGLDIESEDAANIEITLKKKDGIRINVEAIEFYNEITDGNILVAFSSDTIIVDMSISEFEKLLHPEPVNENTSFFKKLKKCLGK